MAAKPDPPVDDRVLSRRAALRRAGLGLGGLSLSGSLFAACAGVPTSSSLPATSATTAARLDGSVRIGFVGPRSGPDAALGAADPYVVDLVRKALAPGLPAGGKLYGVEIVAGDGAIGDPSALVAAPGVDLVLVTGGAELVTAVSAAAEAAAIPCISTGVLWEAWVRARGASVDAAAPFKSTFHFAHGIAQLASTSTTLWQQVHTNRRVGVLWPGDALGRELRASLGPQLAKAGYTIVDPGVPADPAAGWATEIAKIDSAGCDIVDAVPAVAEFPAVCRQIAAQGYTPAIAQFGSAAMVPSQIAATGAAALHVASACAWHPTWPYSSALTGLASADLADGYEAATGRPWLEQLGTTMALFEIAAAAITTSADPKNPPALARAIGDLTVDTTIGHLAWGSGANQNVVATAIAGGQWVKTAGGRVDFAICENSGNGDIPVGGRLVSYS